MRLIKLTLGLVLAALAGSLPAYAANAATVQAIVIIASNEKGPADPKVAPYEATLQRNMPESSFRYVGEGSASVAPGGKATVVIGKDHKLEVEDEKDGALRLKLNWLHASNSVMSGTFNLQRGVPLVLGRRPSNGDVPILIVIAK